MKLEEAVRLASAAGAIRAASKSEVMRAAWDAEEAGPAGEAGQMRAATLLREAYSEMTEEAGRLGVYGGAIQYIAEEIKRPLKYF